jgi:hypothetical protein
MVKHLLVVVTLALSSCGPLSYLNPLSNSGGPTVNANVLAGKENTQQVSGRTTK